MEIKKMIVMIIFQVYVMSGPVESFCQSVLQMAQLEELSESSGEDENGELDVEGAGISFQQFPLDLNSSGHDQLVGSGIFTPEQADELLAHRRKFGPLISIIELQVLQSFDTAFIRKYQKMLIISEPDAFEGRRMAEILKEADHQIMLRSFIDLQRSRGYLSGEAVRYRGVPASAYGRYIFRFSDRIQGGMTFENDKGERIFDDGRVSDFISGHVALKRTGVLKQLVVGDFTATFGQSLTLGSGRRAGLPFSSFGIRKLAEGIRPYRSVNEAAFFRGLSATFEKGVLEMNLFISRMLKDGRVRIDENGNRYVTSLLETGFHRSQKEQSDRRNIKERVACGNIQYRKGGLSIGTTFLTSDYSVNIISDQKPYNQFHFRGSNLKKAGTDISYVHLNTQYFAEFSKSFGSGSAYNLGSVIQLHRSVTYSVGYRNYSRSYSDLFSSPVSSNGGARNERGLWSGLFIKPSPYIEFDVSGDLNHSPWLRYGIDRPVTGYRFQLMSLYKPVRGTEILVRYRKVSGVSGMNQSGIALQAIGEYDREYIRIHISKKMNSSLTFRMRTEWSRVEHRKNLYKGNLLYTDLIYRPMMKRYGFKLRYAIFNTDNYLSRIYAYENDVLYMVSIPAYYYRGSRFYILFSYKLSKQYQIWIRYSETRYSDRNTIGSGYDRIDGNKKSELRIQARIVF